MSNHLLIIRLSAMGDVAMTVPVVRALAHRYPDLRITVLSRAWARPLFQSIGNNISFHEADVKGRHKGFIGLWHLFRELRQLGITHVADLHSVLRSHVVRWLFRLSGVPTARINKHRHERHELCRLGADAFLSQYGPEALPPVISAYAQVLAALGLPLDNLDAIESIDTIATIATIETIEPLDHPAAPLYGIAPFAAHPGKELPVSTVEEAIGIIISRQPNCRIILFGRGKREDITFARWRERWPSNISIAAEQCKDINDELQLMRSLRCMLSMDSANQHLASLVGTRVVTVWGQTHPAAGFAPWKQNPKDSIQTDMACRPCSIFGNKPCRLSGVATGHYPCLESISARQVAEEMSA